jgi:uncharacterized Tic20 family protein
MSAVDELNKLKKLHDDGIITDEQYERAKAKLLEEERAEREGDAARDEGRARDERADEHEDEREDPADRKERRPRRRRARDDDYDDDYRPARPRKAQVREWCLLLHLSHFAGHAIPLGGLIAPVILWQMKKDEWPEVDEHGKNAVNWVISFVLYMVICIALCFVVVGFVLLPVLIVLGIVSPIIAAVKANDGVAWKYPLAIPFLR